MSEVLVKPSSEGGSLSKLPGIGEGNGGSARTLNSLCRLSVQGSFESRILNLPGQVVFLSVLTTAGSSVGFLTQRCRSPDMLHQPLQPPLRGGRLRLGNTTIPPPALYPGHPTRVFLSNRAAGVAFLARGDGGSDLEPRLDYSAVTLSLITSRTYTARL